MPPLVTAFVIENGQRLDYAQYKIEDDISEIQVPWELRKGNPVGAGFICGGTLIIRNGTCSTLARQLSPAPGLNVADSNNFVIQGSTTLATGFTDAMAAIRAAANTPAARKTALQGFLYSSGLVNANLAVT